MKKEGLVKKAIRMILYIALMFIFVYPLLFVIMTALKKPEYLVQNFWLPSIKGFTLNNLYQVWFNFKFYIFFKNSLFVALISTFLQEVFSLTAGYAFAKLKFPFKEHLFYIMLGVMFLPIFIFLIPLFIQMRTVGLTDTLTSLILVYTFIGLPQGVYIARSFFASLPSELKEAGFVDGAGTLHVFLKIMLPLSKPAISCIAILAFVRCWGEYIWATISCTSDTVKTIPVGLSYFTTSSNTYWWYQMAALVLVIIPTVTFYIIFNKSFVRGFTEGAVKG